MFELDKNFSTNKYESKFEDKIKKKTR